MMAMKNKKFEFTGETMILADGREVRRIQALQKLDLARKIVMPGDKGGWLEKEDNLSHENRAWVDDDAVVYGDARIVGPAQIIGCAQISGHARISGDARIIGDAKIGGRAQISGCARISGHARISDDALISGDAQISGDARISGDAQISGCARISGDARISGHARINGDAYLCENDHWLTIGPVGSRSDYVTFFRNKQGEIKVKCGCFYGTIDEFLASVQQTHGENLHGVVYAACVDLAVKQINVKLCEGKG